jgi:hypothetical protein
MQNFFQPAFQDLVAIFLMMISRLHEKNARIISFGFKSTINKIRSNVKEDLKKLILVLIGRYLHLLTLLINLKLMIKKERKK